MKTKRVKKMLLIGGALVATPLAACGPTVIANPKGCFYDDGAYVDNNGNPCGVTEAGADVKDATSFGEASVKDASDDAIDAADATSDSPTDSPSDAPDDGG